MILYIKNKSNKNTKSVAVRENQLLSWIEEIGVQPYYIMDYTDPSCIKMVIMFLQCNCPVITLGDNASKFLKRYKRLNLLHFKLPYHSGMNCQVNDKKIEKKLQECKDWLKYYF